MSGGFQGSGGDATPNDGTDDVVLKDSSGTEIATLANPVRTDPTGVTTQPISAAALPLPTGASTLAEQQTQTTSLQLIDNLPHANNTALSNGVPMMAQLDDTSTGTVTENNVSTLRMNASRGLHTNLRDASGNELTSALAGSNRGLDVELVGNTDGTRIGNLKDRLKTEQAFNSKFRIDSSSSAVSITDTVTYTSVYSYSGSGLLIGFAVEFAATRAVLKFQVDGETIFDSLDIGDWSAFTTSDQTVDKRLAGQGIITSSSSIYFSLKHPIRFATSVTLSARKSSGANFNMSRYLVQIQKDS